MGVAGRLWSGEGEYGGSCTILDREDCGLGAAL